VSHRKPAPATNLEHSRLLCEIKKIELQGKKEYIFSENAGLSKLKYSERR
jgi:hypothetical protein